ncbi:MAG: ElyC/SanA/YdcF family protein [Planctomycetota bacterium]
MSSETSTIDHGKKWKRRCLILVFCWLSCTFLFSFREFRGLCIVPLTVNDENARGDIAYVMADGAAYWERLRAASDLFHQNRVKRIFLLEETKNAGWNYIRDASDSQLQRAIDYLGMFGVPESAIHPVIQKEGWLGSRSEAIGLSKLDENLSEIVVVTSPPHTRRCRMVFRRVFRDRVRVQVYSAANPSESVETFAPIWMEYLKLAAYWLVA